jgi:4-amino-4-deoxy-L-arabinose transferase-like glycosyltransferase
MAISRAKLGLWVWLALAVGVALRLFFVIEAPPMTNDTVLYGDIAKNLLERHVYGFSVAGAAPRPTLIRVPGYPLFLAACFAIFGVGNYKAVLAVQLLADLLGCAMMADLARRLFGPRAGLAALWLAMLCPFTANYVGAALTETLTLFSIAAAFYGMHRWGAAGLGFGRWLWVVAASLAAAVLIRPEQGLLAAAVVPAMLWMAWGPSRQIKQVVPVLVAAICVILPLAPWVARNERTFHVFQPLAPRYANDPGEFVPLGFQRWYRTWAIEFASTENVYWNYDGSDISIADLPNRAFDSQSEYERTAALLNEYNLHDTATPELDQGFEELARERIAADPIRYYVALPAARLANMLLRPRTELMGTALEWWRHQEDTGQRIFGAVYAGLNLGYFVLGGVGLALWWRRGRDTSHDRPLLLAMAGYVALRCALLLTIDNSEPRYTLEFFPLLWVWGSVAAVALAAHRSRRASVSPGSAA